MTHLRVVLLWCWSWVCPVAPSGGSTLSSQLMVTVAESLHHCSSQLQHRQLDISSENSGMWRCSVRKMYWMNVVYHHYVTCGSGRFKNKRRPRDVRLDLGSAHANNIKAFYHPGPGSWLAHHKTLEVVCNEQRNIPLHLQTLSCVSSCSADI